MHLSKSYTTITYERNNKKKGKKKKKGGGGGVGKQDQTKREEIKI